MTETRPIRRHPRVRVPLLVQYRFSLVEDYRTDYLADLSRGGMFIYADELPPVGSILHIQFVSRDGSRIIQGQGRIVRICEAEGPNERRGQAVEFMHFDEDDARYLDDLVQRTLEEQEHPTQRVGRRNERRRAEQALKGR